MPRFGFGYGEAKNKASRNGAAISQIADKGAAFLFASPRPAGQYANGDWWVLGPVTITSITPASTVINGTRSNGTSYTNRSIHGAMLNPGNRSFASGGLVANNGGINPFISQGFDSYTGTTPYLAYQASFNVDPGRTGSPLEVTTGTVVKCLSDTTPATLDPTGRQAPLRFVTLTVVDRIPVSDAIRPGMSRADKASLLRASDFDLSVFQNLAPVTGAPTYAEALSYVSGTFNTFQPSSIESANMMPKTHPDYGREVGNRIHAALLALHLNAFTAEQKRTLLTHLASFVDDIVSRAEEGGIGYANGGGNQWKKPALAVLTAALGLRAPASWVEYCNASLRPTAWAEDTHTSRVTGYDFFVPRLTSDGRPRTAFSFLAVGNDEWGNWGATNRADAGMNWDLFYRVNYNGAFFPGILAVELTTGAQALWNNPAVFRFMRTFWHRRDDNTDATNGPQPFPRAFAATHRPADAGAPQRAAQTVRGDGWSVRFDKGMDEKVAAPSPSDFTVLVNGSPVAVSSVEVWRQTVGGTLASPVSGSDVVTISYTPGTSPLRSVDGVNAASFSGVTMTNRTEKVGGPNAAFPIVRFTPTVKRRMLPNGTWASGNSPLATLALLKFRFSALPSANRQILGTIAGASPITITLQTDGRLAVELRNVTGGGSTRILLNNTAPFVANTTYDIIASFDMSQTTIGAGANCWVNGVQQTPGTFSWGGGSTVSTWWSRPQSTFGGAGDFELNPSGYDFEMGALWLMTGTRIDLTDSATRAKFTSVTGGNLDIGTRGDGINGVIPNVFFVGNADQWSDEWGVNRGSSAFARMMPTQSISPGGNVALEPVVAVSGSEWV